MKKLQTAIKTFIISITSIFITSNQQNILYNFIKILFPSSDSHMKVVNAGIALLISIIEVFLFFIWDKLISKHIARPVIEISIPDEKVKNGEFIFTTNSYDYDQETIYINIKIKPKGKLTLFLLKVLKFKISLFFNPKMLQLEPYQHPNFTSTNDITVIEDKERIDYFILKNYKLNAFKENEFNKGIRILIKPKRVENADCTLSYNVSSKGFFNFSKIFCKFEDVSLKIISQDKG